MSHFKDSSAIDDHEYAIRKLQEYLRIQTVQPHPDYKSCTQFLLKIGEELGLQCQVHEVFPEKPIVIMTLAGTDPSLPALLLNSHTDVVPVSRECWTHDPFGGDLVEGRIYGRGAQDMKSIGVAYLMGLKRLLLRRATSKDGPSPFRRTLHLTWVPDEEIGGVEGMSAFVGTDTFAKLHVGVALDEGIPGPFPSLLLFHGERAPWWIKVKAAGTAGHGSALLQGTAMERLLKCLAQVQLFRTAQMTKLTSSPNVLRDSGQITSVNITMLAAGKQFNVIPDEATACLDVRLARDLGEDGLKSLLDEWTTTSPGLSYEIIRSNPSLADTPTSGPWWETITKVLDDLEVPYEKAIFPGATDSRFLRALGIPAYGISPFRNLPTLLHDHDEYIGVEQYLEGIAVYERLIADLTK